MVSVFEDLAFTDTAVVGPRAFVVFTATCGGTALEGVHLLDVGAGGRVTDLAIFIRPLPALVAIAESMRSAVDPDLLTGHRP